MLSYRVAYFYLSFLPFTYNLDSLPVSLSIFECEFRFMPLVAAQTCSVDGYFADPTDCSHYILCVQGARYRSMCSPGTYFDPRTNQCGYDQGACHRFSPQPRPPPHKTSPGPHHSSGPPHRLNTQPHSSRLPHFTRRPSGDEDRLVDFHTSLILRRTSCCQISYFCHLSFYVDTICSG